MRIESFQNPRIKKLLKLQQKSRERKSEGLFVVEGVQENHLALNSGFEPLTFFLSEGIYRSEIILKNAEQIWIPDKLYEKMAYRGTTGGIIGVYKAKTFKLDQIKLPDNPFIIVLEAVEKPGNLGAVLRSCDGVGADLLIVCDPLTDFFNPNVIRSSVGAVFSIPLVAEEKEKTVEWLKNQGIQIVSTFLKDNTISLYDTNFNRPSAIVLGTEASGLSDFWTENSDVLIKIPMNGKVDSLNVSNAAAICVYEALRQRIQQV